MIRPEIHAQIRRHFYAEHWKIGTIARELGVHPDTVRHAIATASRNMIEPAFRALLVTAIGAPVLMQSGLPAIAAPRSFSVGAVIADSATVVRPVAGKANPQSQNHFARNRHASPPAGLDNDVRLSAGPSEAEPSPLMTGKARPATTMSGPHLSDASPDPDGDPIRESPRSKKGYSASRLTLKADTTSHVPAIRRVV